MKLLRIALYNILLISSIYGMESTEQQPASWFTRMRQKVADTYSYAREKTNQALFQEVEYTTYSQHLIEEAYKSSLDSLMIKLAQEKMSCELYKTIGQKLTTVKNQLLDDLKKEVSEGKTEISLEIDRYTPWELRMYIKEQEMQKLNELTDIFKKALSEE